MILPKGKYPINTCYQHTFDQLQDLVSKVEENILKYAGHTIKMPFHPYYAQQLSYQLFVV